MSKVTPLGVSVRPGRAGDHYAKLSAKFSDPAFKVGTQDLDQLQKLGFGVAGTMDAQPTALQTTASITSPVQFLQTFLPGVVRILQAPLKLDDTIGYTQAGYWEDSEIIQRIMEWTGFVREYGDYQAKPNTSWNMNFAKQSVVRFEIGVETARLQSERAARGMVSDIDEKTGAAALIMQQILNNVGYNGYNSGNNLTYGFLNNPNLPAYNTVPAGVGGLLWSQKTWLEKQTDIITWANGLMSQTQGRANVFGSSGLPSTLTVPVGLMQHFASTTTFGTQSLLQWFQEQFPNARIVSSPNMDTASAGSNGVYWFVDALPDSGTDDGSTFRQVIPARMMALGTQQMVDGYKTGYSCAHAGTFALRPFAVYRANGM